jgi:hypothetical protein
MKCTVLQTALDVTESLHPVEGEFEWHISTFTTSK